MTNHQRARRLRSEGATRRRIAADLGLSLSTVHHYLKTLPPTEQPGEPAPRPLTLGQVAYGLGLPPYAIPY